MEHYRISINDHPLGTWRIFKNGAFFVESRFYSRDRAEKLAKKLSNEIDHAKVSKYKKVPFQDSYAYDEIYQQNGEA